MSNSTYHRSYYERVTRPKRQASRQRAQLRGGSKEIRVRLPEDLHAEITAGAEANRRSLNAEIVSRLERPLDSE